ncbi:MAG: hypothetical protein AABZ31_07665 [Bdellovibrionota bacterium]
MANQQRPQDTERTQSAGTAGRGSMGQDPSMNRSTPGVDRDSRDQKLSSQGSAQRPAGSQSRTDLEEDDESLEGGGYSKGTHEADADVERSPDSSTSSTRKINR